MLSWVAGAALVFALLAGLPLVNDAIAQAPPEPAECPTMEGVADLDPDPAPELAELRAIRAGQVAFCHALVDRLEAVTAESGDRLRIGAGVPIPAQLVDGAGNQLVGEDETLRVQGVSNGTPFTLTQAGGDVFSVQPNCWGTDPEENCEAPQWASTVSVGGDGEEAIQTVVDSIWVFAGLACGLFVSFVLYRSVVG